MPEQLELVIDSKQEKIVTFEVKKMVNMGRTSRDPKDIIKHLEELKAEGITVSSDIPSYNPKIKDRITTSNVIEVLPNSKSSGEVEYVLLFINNNDFYVTIGSDHTDRELEKYNVVLSKQIYPNVISKKVWIYEDVKDHWDELVMKAWVKEKGVAKLYQEGKLNTILRPEELIKKARERVLGDLTGAVIFSGTFPIIGGKLNYEPYFKVELIDNIKHKTLAHEYILEPINWFVTK
ncbi:DUF2848 family protein [Acetomicrobium sp. UBA5826]|uniref:DUF2848 family protein n=1 Tax=Acetomicrobium sp. UBA5826 TaxID=1946039 RepID=UPI00257BFA1D|nr:DUF2848 family protein [Acetomicrobium sp. UBA5826]